MLLGILAVCLGLLSPDLLTCATPSASPNVVLVFCDDMGYGDLGCFGAKGWSTPNLDRLAAEGVRFTRFYVAQAVCSASRAALMTGCYPNRIGIAGALGPNARVGLSTNEMTMAEMVKPRGYVTAIFGKWHLGDHPTFLPTRHGFDEYFGLPYSNDMWPRHPEAKPGTYPPLPLIEREERVQTVTDQDQLTTQYTERAVRFIERNADRPFFLYLAHSMPHVPLHVSEKSKGKSPQGLYGDVIMEIDWSVGEVLRTLNRLRLTDRTLVIFTSDNGPWLSYGNHAGSAGALREGKGTAWEGGIRVPFIARWPGRIPAGSICREPAMTIDLLPTIAGLVGAKRPARKIDGLDIWPLLSGAPGARNPHEAYYCYYANNELQAVMSGRWKLVLPHTYRTLKGQPEGRDGIPTKYVAARIEKPELYDLEADARETTDLAALNPEVVNRLEGYAAKGRTELGDTLTKRKGSATREPGRLAPIKPAGATSNR